MAPSAEAAQQAVGHYRAYYQRKGMFENHVYPGIPEVLTRLKEEQSYTLRLPSQKNLLKRLLLILI